MPSLLLLLSALSGSPLLAAAPPAGDADRTIPPPIVRSFAPRRDEPEVVTQETVARRRVRPIPPDVCVEPDEGQFRQIIHGNAGNDRIYGVPASRLYGDEDRDLVAGGPENDEIHGGEGADRLSGGLGADRFVYASPSASPASERGAWSPLTGDTIFDFFPADGDRIDLSYLPRTGPDAPEAYRWSGERPAPYSAWMQPLNGDTIVLVDRSGDLRGDVAIRLLGSVELSAAAFCGVADSEH